MSVSELIDLDAFGRFRRTLSDTYYRLFEKLTAQFPALTILCHGYDYVLPRSEGPWLGPPLTRRGVPARLWPAILALLIDAFNEELKSLEILFPGRVFHIDCRHQVGSHVNSWNDEIHPKNPGYGRVAARFTERIRAVLQAQERRAIAAPVTERARPARRPAGTPEVAARLIGRQVQGPIELTTSASVTEALISARPGRRAAPGAPAPVIRPQAAVDVDAKAIVAPDAHPCSSLPAWRARLTDEDKEAFDHYMALIDEPEANEVEQRATRERLRASFDISSQERILGESNLFQINFLSRGERAARTVGRISVVNRYGIPMGYGTGFLVAPGLVLTNNHVLDDQALVAHSSILFDYEYDADNELRQIERYALTEDIFYTCPALDCTFVSVAPTSERGRPVADYGRLILVRDSGKALRGEPVSILQHANGLPKQIAMRDSTIVGRKDVYIYYTTDTNPGSSGSPVVNDEWFPVALHHRTVPNWNEPCAYVANRGIRISSIFQQLDHDKASNPMAQRVLDLIDPPSGTASMVVARPSVAVGEGGAAIEALREPYHELPYDHRQGYDPGFLGIPVPLPAVRDPSKVSMRLDGGGQVVPYEHFSLVMFKPRRLALYTAANVSADPALQKPEPGYDYSRDGLSGLREHDMEKWFKDPRLPLQDQLPDRFFTRDHSAFDKGHIVRRNDVVWGESFVQVRRANGDTFHTTNCSPQVKGFNRSNLRGLWGKLENLVLDQADTEKLCVFAGPVLDPGDQSFRGQDEHGEILVQIPSKYWKVVVARSGSILQTFAFVLEQDLSDVPLEFAVDATWRQRMVSIPVLEAIVRHLEFPEALHQSDQAFTGGGESMRHRHAIAFQS
jgi:endonuclease G